MSYTLLGNLAQPTSSPAPRRAAHKVLHLTAKVLSCGTPLLVVGCLTEFPPLVISNGTDTSEDPETSDGSTSSPSSSGQSDGGPFTDGGSNSTDAPSGSSSGGGNTDTSGAISCGAGETACGNVCVVGNSCCDSSCEAPNAESECRDGACAITACAADFFDCDGEYDNGCETSMPSMSAPPATEDEPFVIPRFDYGMGIADIDQTAWANVPRYNLNRACSTCERSGRPEEVPPITPSSNRGVLPPTRDVRGAFALAWNDVGVWVNVVIVDDQWVMGDDVGETDARRYDNVMVVWDSAEGASDAGSGDDRILFAGVDGRLTDWRQTTANGAAIRVTGSGQCRSVHLQLEGRYLFMGSGGSNLLIPGDVHGLNIGYNDFDWVQEDAMSADRQHLVFGFPMTFSSGDYYDGVRTLPQIELGAQ